MIHVNHMKCFKKIILQSIIIISDLINIYAYILNTIQFHFESKKLR